MPNDPNTPPPLQPLDYRRPSESDGPTPLGAVLLFGAGLLVSLPTVGIGAPLFVGGIATFFPDSNGHPKVGLLFGALVLFACGSAAAVGFVRLQRHQARKFFALGFLCGACILFLIEGLCFGAIGASASDVRRV